MATIASAQGVMLPLQAVHFQTISISYADSAGTFDIPLPANCLVIGTWVNVSTLFNGSGATLKVGDSGDDDRFQDTTTTTIGTAGIYPSAADAQPGSKGHLYTSATTLTATFAPGTSATTGAATVTVVYCPLGMAV